MVMNELRSALDWELQVQSWLEAHQRVTEREALLLENRIRAGFQRLPYLQSINPIKTGPDAGQGCNFRIVLKAVGPNQESVLKDYQTILMNYAVGTRKAYVVVRQTDEGFDYHLATLDPNEGVFSCILKTTAPSS